jgi:hypothetical protein
MAQTNYTPISLYYSATAAAVPLAANLVPGELAINTADGKLYYEDSAGVVQVLATKSTGSIGGSNTQVQFNNSGSLGGSSSFTWDGTTVTATKFAGALNGTVGATTASTGAFTTLSTSSTTTLSGLTASTALALDASKNVVSVTNTGTGNNVLSASPTLTGTIAGASLSLSSLTSGRVPYATTAGLLTDSANLLYSGTDLTVYGVRVGRGGGAVSTNTAVGSGAMAATATGTNNTAIGVSALPALTSGTVNTAIGAGTLFNNTIGGSNTAVGSQALQANTTASNNTAVGYQAGYTNTTSAFHTFVGFQAGYTTNNTYGHITAIGNSAAYSNAGGLGITAVGSQALYANTSGNYNIAVGGTDGLGTPAALRNNTTGANNVALGVSALQANTTASNNTAVGYQAGYSNVGGSYNTLIGTQAGYSLAPSAANTINTFVGGQSGYFVTTGTKNTIIGNYSGNQGGLDIRTASNYIVLSDGDGNVEFTAKDGNSWALPGATVQTGTGITFPATQSASSNANTLDDYEEGTWTPVVAFGGASVGVTYSAQQGNYTKIGNRVYISGRVALTNKGSSTGAITITGLPFTSANTLFNSMAIAGFNLASIVGSLQAYNTLNTSLVSEITYLGTGAHTALTNSNCNNDSGFMINFSYAV